MLAIALLGISAAVSQSRAASDLVELYSNPTPGDRSGQVIGVFVDPPPPDEGLPQYHVLSRTEVLGTFELVGTEAHPVIPRLTLPSLEPGEERWVLASEAIGTWELADSGTGLTTTYTRLDLADQGGVTGRVPLRGFWDVLSSSRGDALFFVRGGHTFDDPAELRVLEANGDSGPELTFDELPVVRPSRDGRIFAVQALDQVQVFDGAPTPHTIPGHVGDLWLSPGGEWLALARPGAVEVHEVGGTLVVQLPVVEPVMTVRFAGDHALVVEPSVARLWTIAPGQPVEHPAIPAIPGHSFSSADLQPNSPDGLPWVALGELDVLVPSLSLPGAPPARASVRVRAFDPDGAEVLSWAAEVGDWIAHTPVVEFGLPERQLVVHTPDRAYVSERSFP